MAASGLGRCWALVGKGCARIGQQGQVALGGALGIGLGFALQALEPDDDVLTWVGLPGTLWVRVLRCAVVPLVAASMISSIAGIAFMESSSGGSSSISGARLGGKLLCWYLTTSIWCSAWGLLFFNMFSGAITASDLPEKTSVASISLRCSEAAGGGWVVAANGWAGVASSQPSPLLCNSTSGALATSFIVNGSGAAGQGSTLEPRSFTGTAMALLLGLFPSNYLAAMVSDNLLGVITASMALGAAVSAVAKRHPSKDVEAATTPTSPTPPASPAKLLPRDGSPAASASDAASARPLQPRSSSHIASGDSSAALAFGSRRQRVEKAQASVGHSTGSAIIAFAEELQSAVVVVVEVAIQAAPIAVASLLASTFAGVEDPGRVFAQAGLLIGIHTLATALHAAAVLPLAHWGVTGFSFSGRRTLTAQYAFMAEHCTDAYMTAAATSSSAATLPVTLRCVTDAGVPPTLARFATSLGATLNLDGTSIGYSIVALWMAQTSGLDTSASTQVVVAIMGALASVGAAPIPQAGTVLLISIWAAAFPTNALPPAFGIFLSVDAIIDRVETTCNVIGDTLSARTVAIWAGQEKQLIIGGHRDGEAGKQEADEAITVQVQSPLADLEVSGGK